jgi:hypothetical protein
VCGQSDTGTAFPRLALPVATDKYLKYINFKNGVKILENLLFYRRFLTGVLNIELQRKAFRRRMAIKHNNITVLLLSVIKSIFVIK